MTAVDYKSEVRDGMRIDWDVPIPMSDGVAMRCDIFRPVGDGPYPVILSYGPYGKGLSFQEGYSTAWKLMIDEYPDVARGSSNKYQNWEVVDPEKWVPDGYVCIRVDSRGAGRSPGVSNQHSPQETQDIVECIEWAGVQPWSTGKVGMNGISYYAINAWRAAARQPAHLAAICCWEGNTDRYREASHHGGILSVFAKNWHDMQVKTVQHGRGERGARSAVTGELVCGPETLPDEELAKNRVNMWQEFLEHPLDDAYYRARSPDFSRIEVPLLSAANWGGQGLHLRGNIEGFMRSASPQKWLEVHGGAHWAEFYTDYGVALQKRFFNHFLKGEANGWDRHPAVQLKVRRIDRFEVRLENEWPLARTEWTRFYLDPRTMRLGTQAPADAQDTEYEAMGDGLTFMSEPLKEETEITGPSVLRLNLSSETTDADVFAVLRVFDPQGKEVVFHGALDPNTPIGQGWLRASHRKQDARLSLPYRPYYTHDEVQPLKPGECVALDVEIWPTCIVVPPGYRIGLSVRGKDYEFDGPAATLSNMKNPMKGCGPFVHDDAGDRPPEVFGKRNRLHFSGGKQNYVTLPLIPPKRT
ncbi:CocE/NonD family hydrolase [Ramlibacter sp.]|uniref:CocE/NonD family hydrolase n=1 Tax=Ramlibacter sp. TaxID=1917967 RepID=UPI002639A170|nr:CocE/NonD family hydrolase [Ramlibacter sp.]MDB5957499.1 peptidase [Ramlibacter sp.]